MLQVNISDETISQLEQIAQWITLMHNKEKAKEIVAKFYYYANILGASPFIGRREPLLMNIEFPQYRSLKFDRYNRIIYYITDRSIEIIDIWDMRMNPDDLTERV